MMLMFATVGFDFSTATTLTAVAAAILACLSVARARRHRRQSEAHTVEVVVDGHEIVVENFRGSNDDFRRLRATVLQQVGSRPVPARGQPRPRASSPLR